MRWIILVDHQSTPEDLDSLGLSTRIGVGKLPNTAREAIRATNEPEARLKACKDFVAESMKGAERRLDYEWRTKDDDGNLCYSGRCENPGDWDEGFAFAPLDWCMADVGATTFEFRKAGVGHAWEVL